MKVGASVRFRRTKDPFMKLWVDWWTAKHGKGPYTISEVLQGTSGTLYKLQPNAEIAFSKTWLVEETI